MREELRGILASRRGCPGVEPGEFVGIVHQTMRPILTGGNGKEVVQRVGGVNYRRQPAILSAASPFGGLMCRLMLFVMDSKPLIADPDVLDIGRDSGSPERRSEIGNGGGA